MSEKALLNNRNGKTCSRSGDMATLCGCSYGSHTPEGMVRFECCRTTYKDGRVYFFKGPHYGKIVTKEEYERMSREYGFVVGYSRNCNRFVMSRAARKRGYTTDDWMYNNVKKRYHQ